MKSIVITGASSGIGKATAHHFAAQGWRVAATMRQPDGNSDLAQTPNLSVYRMDVTDDENVTSTAQRIITDFGKVDVVLNNAGYGLMGPFEAASWTDIQRQFDTNLFGVMRVTRAFLPHFRSNQGGLFINVSSINGLTTLPFGSLYISTKFALEGFSETLSYELGELGIGVKLIEPGGVATDFAGRSLVFAMQEGLTAYDEALGKFNANFRNSGLAGSPVTLVAEAIYTAATDEKTQMRYLVGKDAEQMLAQRNKLSDDKYIEQMKERILS